MVTGRRAVRRCDGDLCAPRLWRRHDVERWLISREQADELLPGLDEELR